MSARVVVLTKDPVPGRVKTRLIPALGPQGAAALHRALVERCLRTCAASGLPVVLALDGDPDGELAALAHSLGATITGQARGDLGDRLRAALRGPQRQVCVGTDCPSLRPEHLRSAAAASGRVVLGPALDGGYWLVAHDGAPPGQDPPGHALFDDIPWSTGQVLERTLERARRAALRVELLESLRDLDTPRDLVDYAADPGASPRLLPLLRA